MLRRLNTLYKIIHCVALHTLSGITQGVNCQIITQKSVNFLRSFWKNLHRTEKSYTGTARGARDKYKVWGQGQVKI